MAEHSASNLNILCSTEQKQLYNCLRGSFKLTSRSIVVGNKGQLSSRSYFGFHLTVKNGPRARSKRPTWSVCSSSILTLLLLVVDSFFLRRDPLLHISHMDVHLAAFHFLNFNMDRGLSIGKARPRETTGNRRDYQPCDTQDEGGCFPKHIRFDTKTLVQPLPNKKDQNE